MTPRRLTIDYDGDPLTVELVDALHDLMDAHAPGIDMSDGPLCRSCNNTGRVWLPKPTYGSPRYHPHPCKDCGGRE